MYIRHLPQISRSSGSGVTELPEREDELGLFHELDRREQEDISFIQSASIQITERTAQDEDKLVNQSLRRALEAGHNDFLSSDWDKNDYDWLLTPPATPPVTRLELGPRSTGFLTPDGTISAKSDLEVSRFRNSKSEPPLRAERSASILHCKTTSEGLSSSAAMNLLKPMPLGSNKVTSRSSTPTSAANRTPSGPSSIAVSRTAPNSMPVSQSSLSLLNDPYVSHPSPPGGLSTVSRPSTPISRSKSLSSNVSSTIRPAASSVGRAPSPSITRPASVSSTVRSATPSGRRDPSPSNTRPASVASSVTVSSTSRSATPLGRRDPSPSNTRPASVASIARPATPLGGRTRSPLVTRSVTMTTTAQPATPAKGRAPSPSITQSSMTSNARPATPSKGCAASPSVTRSASSSRQSSPVKRAATPGPQSTTNVIKSPSFNRSCGPTVTKNAASSRSSSPASKALHPAIIPGLSAELPPPNLRTSIPDRSSSNSRSSYVSSRSGGPLSTKTIEVVDVRSRRQSSSPVVTRGRLSLAADVQPRDMVIHTDGRNEVNRIFASSNASGSKMVDRTLKPRKPVHVQEKQDSMTNTAVKKSPKPMPSRDGRSTPGKPSPSREVKSTVRESSGFGRNLSKKSLDMALRHMDIGANTANGFQSFMSNVSTSSLYSIKSRATRMSSSTFVADSSPVATSSNASSEHSVNIVMDREGSWYDEENMTEKASRSSSGSRSNALLTITNERRVTNWLGNPDYREKADEIQMFEQHVETLSSTESPLVSPYTDGVVDSDSFRLEPFE